jgi:hypothetical protein
MPDADRCVSEPDELLQLKQRCQRWGQQRLWIIAWSGCSLDAQNTSSWFVRSVLMLYLQSQRPQLGDGWARLSCCIVAWEICADISLCRCTERVVRVVASTVFEFYLAGGHWT